MELTESDLAAYLTAHPDFFERHPDLLTSVQLPSPHGNRAVSLQERQMEMLRDKMRTLEHRLAGMMRNATDNEALATRLLDWARDVILAQQGDAQALPGALLQSLQTHFDLPLAAVRLWPVAAGNADQPWAQDVGEDVRSFAASLTAPYCGPNAGFEAAQCLPNAQMAQSLAFIPLHHPGSGQCIGLLVLGSPDPQRFGADMGTAFLHHIAQFTSAALRPLVLADPH